MKNSFKLFLAAAAFVGFAGTASAQDLNGGNGEGADATATATASAKIISPIDVNKITDLNFGTWIPSSTDGSFVVVPHATNPAGTISGGITPMYINAAPITAAEFSVTGEAGYGYNFAVTTPTPLALGGGVTVTAFSTSAASGTGSGTHYVGGTLNVPTGTSAGNYSATFEVEAQYQ